MKIQTTTTEMKRALDSVISVVPKKPFLPVLTNIHFEVASGLLYTKATDLDVEIVHTTEVDSDEEGVFLLPSDRLHKLVKSFPEAPMTITVKGEKVTIKAGKSRSTFTAEDGTDYPSMRQVLTGRDAQVHKSILSTMLKNTKNFVSRDELKAAMCGVKMDINESTLSVVATSGHRIILQKTEVQCHTSASFIIPAMVIKAVGGISSGVEDVGIGWAKGDDGEANCVSIEIGQTRVTFTPISEIYPKTEQITNPAPQMQTNYMTCDKKELAKTLDRMSVMGTKANNTCTVALNISKDSGSVWTRNSDFGADSNEDLHLDTDWDEEEPIEIGFMISNLAPCLGVIGSDEVTVRFHAPNKIVLIEETEQVDPSIEMVVVAMPAVIFAK